MDKKLKLEGNSEEKRGFKFAQNPIGSQLRNAEKGKYLLITYKGGLSPTRGIFFDTVDFIRGMETYYELIHKKSKYDDIYKYKQANLGSSYKTRPEDKVKVVIKEKPNIVVFDTHSYRFKFDINKIPVGSYLWNVSHVDGELYNYVELDVGEDDMMDIYNHYMEGKPIDEKILKEWS